MRKGETAMDWVAIYLGVVLALWFIQITLWIDPGWEDARKEVPLLDAMVRPLARFQPLAECLGNAYMVVYVLMTILGIGFALR
jgi:hypothetical protein